MCQIYRGGYVSGAHYNPAVTVAVLIENLFRPEENKSDSKWHFASKKAITALVYWGSQFLGGLLAGVVGYLFLGVSMGAPCVGNYPAASAYSGLKVSMGIAIGVEVLGTFALAYTVLMTAVGVAKANNYYGIAIGSSVTCMAYAVGGLSGGSFNPAVGVLNLFVNAADFYVYLIGPLC